MLTKIKGSMLDPSAVSDRLGYIPVNKANDTITGTLNFSSTGAPLTLTGGGANGTYDKTVIYNANNNTSGSSNNGIFIEMARLSDLSTAEARRFIIGTRGGQKSLEVDGYNRILTPNQPSFSAYSPAVTATGNNVIWGSTRHNTGNCYNTSNGRFTAPIAGVYIFTFNSLMQINADYCRLYFNVNNVHNPTYGDTLVGGTNGTWNAGWSYTSIGLTLVIQLAANDWVSVWNDGPTATYGTGYGTFSGHLLG